MLATITKNLLYLTRTSKPPKPNLQKIAQMRKYLMHEIFDTYSSSDRPHEDRVYEQVLYGRKCYIAGLTPDSTQSASYIRSICLGLNPDLVILGGFNSSRLISGRIARTVQEKRLVRGYDTLTQPSQLFCKSLITPMITKLTEQDPNYCSDEDTETVYIFDHKNKHVHASNYLTIMNRLMYHQFSKMSFGMPSDYIVFEDLMINQSVQTLREIFQRVVAVTKANRDQRGIQEISFMYYPDIVLEEMRYHAVLEPVLSRKQLVYTTALLNKSVRTSQRVMLFVQNQYVPQIAENVHKITLDPKQVYRGGQKNAYDFIKNSTSEAGIKLNRYLNAENKDESINELIQKMIILNQLKNDTLEKELLEGNLNIFGKTVFAGLFGELTLEEIQSRYRRIKIKYSEAMGSIIQKRVKAAIQYKQPSKNFYTLTQMIKTQQQRNLDFPMQLQIQNYATIAQQKQDLLQIHDQIERMIKQQLSESERELIQYHRKGCISRDSIVLNQKLVVEAKLRLKKTGVKLPVLGYGALSAVFKDQMVNLMLGKKGSKTEKQALMNRIEELKSKGKIIEVSSQQEVQQLVGENSTRISLDLDESGQISLHEDGNTVESIQKVMQNNEFMKQMFDLNQSQTDEFYKEEDEKLSTRVKRGGNKISEKRSLKSRIKK